MSIAIIDNNAPGSGPRVRRVFPVMTGLQLVSYMGVDGPTTLSNQVARGATPGVLTGSPTYSASHVIPACADFDSRWDSQDADFLIRCSEQEEARDGGSDWGSNGLHIGGFAAVGAALW